MPWKNGLGVTQQIDIQPPGSMFPRDEFSWRLSTAIVTGANEFSTFPGYDRILVVWKGEGLLLNQQQRLVPMEPFTFHGEDKIDCDLIKADDVVMDYGIIFCRKTAEASLGIASTDHLNIETGTHYLTCIGGSFSVEDHGRRTEVNTDDTLIIVSKNSNESLQLCSADNSKPTFFHVTARIK